MNANIERLRIFAALGIVTFHAYWDKPSIFKKIGLAGLPVFVLLTFFFGTNSQLHKPESFATFWIIKTKRFLLPLIIWMVFYLLIDVVIALKFHNSISGIKFDLLFGTRIHLWYLSFAFLGLIFVFAVTKSYHSQLVYLYIVILISISFSWIFFMEYIRILIPKIGPLAQYNDAAPALLLGIALAIINQLPKITKMRLYILIMFLLIAILGTKFIQYTELNNFLISYGIAIPLILMAIIHPGKMDNITKFFAPLTLGIYLIHPFFISLMNFHKIIPIHTTRTTQFIVAFILSAITTYLLKLTKIKFVI